jgi:hypothetical protein
VCPCRVLEVGVMDGVSSSGISALRKLQSLEEFLFEPEGAFNLVDLRLVRMCLQLLPHLHAIGYKPTFPHYLCEVMNIFVGSAMSQLDVPCTLQLRRLAVTSISQVPEHVSLPQLQAFYQTDPLYELHPLFSGGLPKLSKLYLSETDEDTLLLILGHVGRQLRTLNFSILDGGWVQLDRLLHACPNLSMLDISTSLSPQSTSQLLPDTLKHLRTLRFYLSSSDWMPSGLLLQILQLASQLQSFELDSVMLRDKDLRAWAELAKEGVCMQHLEEVYWYLDSRDLIKQQGKRLVDELLVSCSVHCPQMQQFYVSYTP